MDALRYGWNVISVFSRTSSPIGSAVILEKVENLKSLKLMAIMNKGVP